MQNELAVGIKTFHREERLFDMIDSVLKELPEAKMYIADDSFEISPRKMELYENLKKEGHIIIRLPLDFGLGRSRNKIIERIKEPYFLLCDDDFIIESDNKIDTIIKILKQRPDIGLITGTLYIEGKPSGYEFNLEIKNRTIFKKPLTSEWEEIEGLKIRQTNLGLNWFVARKEVFNDAKWDNNLITSTEHLDFFLSVKNTKWKVYFCPELRSIHNVCQGDMWYQRYRNRKFHWKYFANKWNVDWCEEFPQRINYRTEADLWSAQPEHINHIIFRDDDICVDTPVAKLKEISNLFEEYGIDELYSVVPYGNMVKDGEYSKDNYKLDIITGNEPIEKNKELVEFLKNRVKNGHNICLHGFRHINMEDKHLDEILKAKEYLEKLLECRIFYFAPPFNNISEILKTELEKRDIKVLAREGNALEYFIDNDMDLNTEFCWYHWWRFLQKPELYDKLKSWLKVHYKKLSEYSAQI